MKQQFENQLPDDRPADGAPPATAIAPGATPPPLDLAGTDADRAPSKPAPAHPPGGVVSHTPGRRDRPLLRGFPDWFVEARIAHWPRFGLLSVGVPDCEGARERGRDAGGKGRG
jgi:hypothetical protein